MKKLTLFLAMLMVLSPAQGFSLSPTAMVDGVIDETMKSDIRPVEDSGRILDLTHEGVKKTYHTVTDPMEPVLKPIRKVRDEVLKGSKKVINTTWDTVTLRHLRDKK